MGITDCPIVNYAMVISKLVGKTADNITHNGIAEQTACTIISIDDITKHREYTLQTNRNICTQFF